MPRYRIGHRPTGAFRELEAPFAQDACTLAGWKIGDCHVELIREGPLTYPDRPERLITHSQDLTELQQRLAAVEAALGLIRTLAYDGMLSLAACRDLTEAQAELLTRFRRIQSIASGDKP
jgi:hypothetical protein